MKKLVSLVIAMILVAVMVVPALANGAPSAEEGVVTVATKADMPNASEKDAPNFVYVEAEQTKYVKYEDYMGELSYVPEADVPTSYEIGEKVDPWTKGKDGDAKFVSNAPFDKFESVLVDNKVVDAANYDAVSGSTDVTLHKDYLETLDLGEHKLVIKSTDGYAKTTFNVVEEGGSGKTPAEQPPKTDDNSKTFMWTAISLVSLGAIGVVAFALAKKRKSAGE